jgi:ABC-type nitrate/sulfonate/bicarbonate transport system permease component
MMKNSVYPFLTSIVLVLLVWEGMVTFGDFAAWQLPSPALVGSELRNWVTGGDYWLDIQATIMIAIIGFLLSILVGIETAAVLYFFPLLKKLMTPILLWSQNVPVIVLAPLLVVWFGFGMTAKLFIVVLVCFFPITIAMLDAFHHVDHNLQRYLEMSGATKWQTFIHLSLPSSIPVLFSSCKLSATYSVMGAVVAEWLGTEHGLGMIMTQAASSFRTDRVFVAILLIVLLSACFFFCIWLLEQIWLWKRKRI